MTKKVSLTEIHEVLLKTINEDPDFQVKTLIAIQMAQRNINKLMRLSKSSNPEVRDIIALSLQEYPNKSEIIEELIEWFEVETDKSSLEKLFSTLSLALQSVSKEVELKNVSIILERMIEKENHLLYSLKLIGYCSVLLAEEIFLEKIKTYRFDNNIRKSIFVGIHNLVRKNLSLPDNLQNMLMDVLAITYEPPELRGICLEALSEIKNQQVIDLLELIIETDHNPFLRKRCVEILGTWQVVELSNLLINKLRFDGIPDVRAACALSLGAMSSFEALPDLSEALELEPSFSVREAAAEALGHLKSQRAVMALLKGLEDQDSYVRSTSAWSIEQLKPDKELIKKICDVIASSEQEFKIRAGMISVLTRIDAVQDAAACLILILKSDRTPIREIILEGLEHFVSVLREDNNFLNNELPFILEMLIQSSSFSLRAAICTFLGHLKVDSTFTFLLDRLLKDEDALVKRQAAWAIANLNPYNHKGEIFSLLEDKEFLNLVPLFLEILTVWYDVDDIQLAISYLKLENDIEWRIRAVELLTAIISSSEIDLTEQQDKTLINKMIEILKNDPASNVRAASAYALGHFSLNSEYDKLIIPALINAIKTEKIYTVRELAAQALGYRGRGDSNIVSEFGELLKSDFEKDPSIRYFAALALLNYETQLRNVIKEKINDS